MPPLRRAPRSGRLAVDLYGHGRVAQALLPRLESAGVPLASVRDSKRQLRRDPAADGRRVLVDATTPRYHGRASTAWIDHLERTLRSGTPVVTCNKAPLALDWRRLTDAASAGDTVLACSATVGGGTPVLALLRRLDRCHGLERVDATLSGTLSFVLHSVGLGSSFDSAVRSAQFAGLAESDPSLDLDGTDSFAKGVIVHNLLFPNAEPQRLDATRPRLRIVEEVVRAHAAKGESPQGVVTIAPGLVDLSWRTDAPNHSGNPSGQIVVWASLSGGSRVVLTGPGAGPAVTAGAILGDLKDLARPKSGRSAGVLP